MLAASSSISLATSRTRTCPFPITRSARGTSFTPVIFARIVIVSSVGMFLAVHAVRVNHGQLDDSPKFLSVKNSDICALCIFDVPIEIALLCCQHFLNSRLNRIENQKANYVKGAIAAEPMRALYCLILHRRIPPSVKENNRRRLLDIKTDPTGP